MSNGDLAQRLIPDPNNRRIMFEVLTTNNKVEELKLIVTTTVKDVLLYMLSTNVNYLDRIYRAVSSPHVLSPNVSTQAVLDILSHIGINYENDKAFAQNYVTHYYPFIKNDNCSFLGKSFELIPLLHKSHLYYIIRTCLRDLQLDIPWESKLICKMFILGYLLAGFFKICPTMLRDGSANCVEVALCQLLCAFRCQKYWLEHKISSFSVSLQEQNREEYIIHSMYTLART